VPPAVQGTATLAPSAPLVNASVVRVEGSGWLPNRQLRFVLCTGPGFDTCSVPEFIPPQPITNDAGAFRFYPWLNAPEECVAQVNACSLVVGDFHYFEATAVRLPLSFTTSESVSITAHYEPAHEALYQQGLALSGLPEAEFQRAARIVGLYLFSRSGVTAGAHLSTDGSSSHTASYTQQEYQEAAASAARYDYTVEEFQKTSTLLWSWILAGQLPLPR
jgi:hypothetical protein